MHSKHAIARHITPAPDGEYSTIALGDMIETCYFSNDGSSRIVSRTPIAAIARDHIAGDWHYWNGGQ